ncbi:hypothetical protein BKA93DRAFT_474847 [Sparassis latifolia]
MYSNYLTLIPLIEHIGGQLRLYPAHVLAIQTDDVDSGGPVSYATIMAGVAAHGRQSVPSLLHSLLTAVSNADYRRIHDLSRCVYRNLCLCVVKAAGFFVFYLAGNGMNPRLESLRSSRSRRTSPRRHAHDLWCDQCPRLCRCGSRKLIVSRCGRLSHIRQSLSVAHVGPA